MQMSPMETMCMISILFSVKNKKNITSLLSAELAKRVVKFNFHLETFENEQCMAPG